MVNTWFPNVDEVVMKNISTNEWQWQLKPTNTNETNLDKNKIQDI